MAKIGGDRLIQSLISRREIIFFERFVQLLRIGMHRAMLESDADMRNRLSAGAGCEPKER